MTPAELVRFVNRELSARRMTLYQLAAATGLSRPSLSRWLNGTRTMKVDQAHRILHALGYELHPRAIRKHRQ